jgi:hypothetical protein
LKGINDTIKTVEVVLANPNLDQFDVINAAVGAMTPEAILDLQTEISRYLQGANLGMGTPMAEGGIVTRATSIVAGEAGAEAIIPLDRMSEFGMGGGNNVTINVNGGDPQAVVDALRRYMQLNGSVPIRVSA